MGNQNKRLKLEREAKERREGLIELLPNEINKEIEIWESIRSCNYSGKSSVFNKTIDVDNILKQLYKAKSDNKFAILQTKPLYAYYYSEEEKRIDEERRKLEEEERRKREKEERQKV